MVDLNYLKKWANSAKEVFLNPNKFFAKMKKRDEFEHSFRFALTTLIIIGLFEVVVFDWIIQKSFLLGSMAFFTRLLLRLAIFHLFTGMIHLMLWIFGSRRKYAETYHGLAHYYPVPLIIAMIFVLLRYAFSFAPLNNGMILINSISILLLTYIVYVQVTAMASVHKMNKWKVLLATTIVPLLVIGIVGLLIFAPRYGLV